RKQEQPQQGCPASSNSGCSGPIGSVTYHHKGPERRGGHCLLNGQKVLLNGQSAAASDAAGLRI
nr:hypothetical protein [Tanacetum cinerariifolium]